MVRCNPGHGKYPRNGHRPGLLTALDHCPLTVRQILKFSQTFDRPFTSQRRLQHRLQLLRDAGRVRRFAYATAGPGAPSYYTLSPDGYRIVRGEDVPRR